MDLKTLSDTPPWEWPESAGKIIKKTLTNKRADLPERLEAADLAGNLVVMSDDLADALLTVTSAADEPEELRATAAISLGPVLEEADMQGFEDDLGDVSISEETFELIRDRLQKLYSDESLPKLVRRRILEASVRSPQDWHKDAIKTAYTSGDRDWMLTSVFAMDWVRGFDEQILESLKSEDPEIHTEAVKAAGTWELDPAWPHVLHLVEAPATPKNLRLEAISSLGQIRPKEAEPILTELAESEDEDIAEAADEALAMIEGGPFDEEEMESEWLN